MMGKMKQQWHWHQKALILLVLDCLAIAVVYFGALYIRFDFVFKNIPREFLDSYMHSILI